MIDLNDVPDARKLPAARREADVRMLSALIRSEAAPAARRSTRRVAVLSVGTFAVLAVGGAAAARTLLPPRTAQLQDQGRCYSAISSNFGDDFPGTTISNAATQAQAAPAVPPTIIDDCAAAWRIGVLKLDDPHVGAQPSGDYPVPPLVACVLPSGEAAVFPGPPTTCGDLGLPSLTS